MPASFWTTLPRPCFVLAPMSGVTDAAFRRIIAKYGRPHATWTEFTAADGLNSPGRQFMLHDLWFTESERPVVAQLYGGRPQNYGPAAQLCAELGFDGIDINMGCPARDVERHKAGAALIRNPQLAREIIERTLEGSGGLPVSVKTRIGYHDNEVETWLAMLLQSGIAALTIHARTRDEMSKVPARWDTVAQAVTLNQALHTDPAARPLIIGNGDVENLAQARERAAETGCDGVMIGRGIFGNPWLFNPDVDRADIPVPEILEVMLEHTALYIELLGGIKPLELMKKHYKAYVTGFEGAHELRMRLMAARDFAELAAIVRGAQAELRGLTPSPGCPSAAGHPALPA
jgi:nifR3 family TIM-barrel protein